MTPVLAPLILPATSATESDAETAISTPGVVPAVKLPPDHLPICKCSIPAPTPVPVGMASEVDTWALASCETSTLKVVSTVPPMAVADTNLLSDELAETDEAFQDYVIVHELLHLRYRTHGKRFHAMMSALVPNWRELERQSQHSTERRRIGH